MADLSIPLTPITINVGDAGHATMHTTERDYIESMRQAVIGRTGSRTLYVAGNDEPPEVKNSADFTCNGTNDHLVINQALNAVGIDTLSRGTNGGKVVLVGRNFNCAGAILIPSQTWLTGSYGRTGTWLTRSGSYAPGATGGLVQLHGLGTQYTTLTDIGMRGGNANMCGIYYTMDNAQEWDGYHIIDNVYIEGVGAHGVHFNNQAGRLRRNFTSRVSVISAGLDGFHVNCPDSFWMMCDTGSAGAVGFNCLHSNNRIWGCKSWFSDSDGFSFTVGGRNEVACCEAQDNFGHGYRIAGIDNTFAGCSADSNGFNGQFAGGGPVTNFTGSGFYVSAANFNLTGCAAYDKRESSRFNSGVTPFSYQHYGFEFPNPGSSLGVCLGTDRQSATAKQLGAPGGDVSIIDVG